MKSIFLTITFVYSAFALSAQSDDIVKVLMVKGQYDYLTTNIVELQNSVAVIQDAYSRSDNYAIGKSKGEIIKIVHQAPSILNNFCSMALATTKNPDIAGDRHQLDYKAYAEKVNQNGEYVEIELLSSEVETLNSLIQTIRNKKYRLKDSDYAIHESQKSEGSEKNVEMLAELTVEMNEAIEILKIGKHR